MAYHMGTEKLEHGIYLFEYIFMLASRQVKFPKLKSTIGAPNVSHQYCAAICLFTGM